MTAVVAPWALFPASWISIGPRPATQQPRPSRPEEPFGPRGLAQALSDSADAVLVAPERTKEAASESLGELVDSALRRLDTKIEEDRDEIVAHLLARDVPQKLLTALQALGFEERKAAARLLDTLVRPGAAGRRGEAAQRVEDYVRQRPRIIRELLEGCGNSEVFFLCAQLLRSCAQSVRLAEAMLEAGAVPRLLELAAQHQSFDVSSEAFSSLHELMLAHTDASAEYVKAHGQLFFPAFHALLTQDDNYVIQRQALRMLARLLLDTHFQPIMTEYVRSEQNLQIHMNLLKNDSVTIQLEAFHVFKLFAANPRKPPRVRSILARNHRGLVKLLRTFAEKQKDDENFGEDLGTVLRVLGELEAWSLERRPSSNSEEGQA